MCVYINKGKARNAKVWTILNSIRWQEASRKVCLLDVRLPGATEDFSRGNLSEKSSQLQIARPLRSSLGVEKGY